jgi:hypothetical protein
LQDFIDERLSNSEIPQDSLAYEEIFRELQAIRVPIAFFTFDSPGKSACRMRNGNGNYVSVSCVRLFLRFEKDIDDTGIDRGDGNWSGRWSLTGRVRDLVNGALKRYAFPAGFVSVDALIHLDSLERIALLQIGKDCKRNVKELLEREISSLKISEIFWDGCRFTAAADSSCDVKRIPKRQIAEIRKAVSKILQSADTGRYCQNYAADVVVAGAKANLFHVSRDCD